MRADAFEDRDLLANLSLADLVDAPMLQSMMDDFYALTSIPMSLIDLDGVVIVGAGWQEVCTRFHRTDPRTCAYCVESDTILTADIPVGKAELYKCKNGMWDAATPIHVGGVRIAHLFTGQFFFEDEPVDLQFFRDQARRYGFREDEYLDAVQYVPRLSRSAVETGLQFLTKLSNMISRLTFTNIERERVEDRLKAALETQTLLTEEVAAERGILQTIMDNTDAHLAYLDPDFRFVAVNATYATGSGHTEEELVGRGHFELFPNEENEAIFRRVRDTGEPIEFLAKPFEFPDQPWRGVTYWNWRLTPVKDPAGNIRGFAFSLLDVTSTVRAKRYSDALNRLNDVIHSTLRFDSIVAEVVPELAVAMGSESVALVLPERSGIWQVMEASGTQQTAASRVLSDVALDKALRALEGGRTVMMTETDGSLDPQLAEEFGARSMLMAPLSSARGIMGIVVFGFVSGPGTFDDEQVDFAGKIAASVSLALENARMYEIEHRIANQLQKALLALPDELAGAQFAHAYYSATETALVGGDFYDIFELDADHLGVTVGDVAGKGLDAAVLTSLVKNTIRAHAAEKGKTPSRVLELANDVLYKTTPAESFVTVFFGILDCRRGSLVYASAGHTAAMIVAPDGTVSRLTATGPLLGAFGDVSFGQAETNLGDDQTLFLYTDGLIEARRDGEFYGEERLLQLLSGLERHDANGVIEDVLGSVLSFTDSHLSDDLAMLAVRRQVLP